MSGATDESRGGLSAWVEVLIHPALMTLLAMRVRAAVRRFLKKLQTPAGCLFAGVAGGFMMLWLGPALLESFLRPDPSPEGIRRYGPLMLFGYTLLTLFSAKRERGIFFSASEVTFLFAGPYSRRQLLVYKLISQQIGVLIISIFFTAIFAVRASTLFGGWLGILLSLSFMNLIQTLIVLLGQSLRERAYNLSRKLALAGLALILVGGALAEVPVDLERPDPFAILRGVLESRTLAIMTLPFLPFVEVMAAPGLAAMAPWLGLALALQLTAVWIIVRLDADFLEASMATSRRVHERLEKARRGQTVWTPAAGSTRRRIPGPWHLFGAGPILWRQLTTAIRSSSGAFLFSFLLLAGFVAFGVIGSTGRLDDEIQTLVTMGGVALLFILPGFLTFDFRGDMENLESLRLLPVSPYAIVLGELAAPVLVASCVAVPPFLILGPTLGLDPLSIGLAAVLIPAVLTFTIGLENLVFLLSPGRQSVNAGDLQGFGRNILLSLLKGLVFIGAIAVTGVLMLIGSAILGRSPAWLFVASGLVTAAAADILLIPTLARAFQRIEPTRDLTEDS